MIEKMSFDTQSYKKEETAIERMQNMRVKKFCGQCGNKLGPTDANCSNCGEEIGNDKIQGYQEVLADIARVKAEAL